MLSGLIQKPLIAVGVVPLVKFWRTGVEAFRTNMAYAVETGMSGDRLFKVYYSQKALLRHIHNEASGFDRNGWGAHTVFNRRDPLTEDERSIISRFRYGEFNREFRALLGQLETFGVDRDYRRLAKYIKEEHRLFPSLKNIFRSLVSRHSLEACRRRIEIRNEVANSQQFASPEIYSRAKTIFDSILVDAVEQTVDGFPIDIYMSGFKVTFRYRAKKSDNKFGQKSILENKENLDWGIDITTTRRGTRLVTVMMTRDSFATSGVVATRRDTAKNLRTFGSVSYIDIVSLARLFIGVQPYHGYELTKNGQLDISRTPTYKVIESGRQLIEPIAHNMFQSIHTADTVP